MSGYFTFASLRYNLKKLKIIMFMIKIQMINTATSQMNENKSDKVVFVFGK